jgi:hypothetical protein
MSNLTPLASGQITATDAIVVVLAEPADMPATIVIHWPAASTVCDPRRFPDVAATVAQLFARAHIVLAAIRAGRKL